MEFKTAAAGDLNHPPIIKKTKGKRLFPFQPYHHQVINQPATFQLS